MRTHVIPPMKASELIAALQKIIEAHGDLNVFSIADWEYVTDAEVEDNPKYTKDSGPFIVLG